MTTGQNRVSGICLSLCSPCFKVSLGRLKFPGGRGRPPCKGDEPLGLHEGSKNKEYIGEEPHHSSCQPAASPQKLLSVLELWFMALPWSSFFLLRMAQNEMEEYYCFPAVSFLSVYIFLLLGFHKPYIILLQSTQHIKCMFIYNTYTSHVYIKYNLEQDFKISCLVTAVLTYISTCSFV